MAWATTATSTATVDRDRDEVTDRDGGRAHEPVGDDTRTEAARRDPDADAGRDRYADDGVGSRSESGGDMSDEERAASDRDRAAADREQAAADREGELRDRR